MELPDALHQNLLEQIRQCVMLLDDEGRIQYVNHACEELIGLSRDRLTDAYLTEFVSGDAEDLRQLIRNTAGGSSSENEHTRSEVLELQTGDDEPTVIGFTAQPFEASVTSAKVLLELGVRHRASYLQKISNQLPGVLYEVEDQGDQLEFTFTSSGYEHFAGPGAKLAYPESMEQVHPRDREELSDHMFSAIENRESFQAEYRYQRDDGSIVWARAQSEPYQKADGTYAWIGVIIDITRLIETRNSLEQALNEKETLLREVHHRVKNNLEIISSMLKLQRANIDDDHARSAMNESLNRIQSMALVHRLLHDGDRTDQLNLNTYGHRIINQIWTSHLPAGVDLERTMELEDVKLDIDTAVPCGLILNELITNALQHAFPDQDHGSVEIRFKRHDGTVELCVSDDGRGLPEDFDPAETNELGIRMVMSLVRDNLDGEMNIHAEDGTTVQITFPAEGS